MLSKVQSLIEQGNLKKAVQSLRAVENIAELPAAEVLRYFQLSRRAGDFQYGSIQLEKLEKFQPELEVEMAFFLGELGAVHQAIRLLAAQRKTLSQELEIQKLLQLGSFQSLTHDYGAAIYTFLMMEKMAAGFRPVLALVARLNILGHRIYQGNDVAGTLQELADFESGPARQYPLIHQGAFYFLAVGQQKIHQISQAQRNLARAQALGVEHRLRESMLIELTRWGLDPAILTKGEITKLKRKVTDQVHILYWDQFQKIMGHRYELEGNLNAANRLYQNVLFGDRRHSHRDECEERWRILNSKESDIGGWAIERRLATPMSANMIIYNKLERRQWPLFTAKGTDFSLNQAGGLNWKICEYLVRNLEFPVRDAEAWENIWDSQFSFISSSTVIRTALSRWRKSNISTCATIQQKDRRLHLSLQPGVQFYTPG